MHRFWHVCCAYGDEPVSRSDHGLQSSDGARQDPMTDEEDEMPAITSIALVLVTGLPFFMTACAPPTPKVQQRPTAVPQSIEQGPQEPVRELDRSFRPMVREGSGTTPAYHG